MAQDRFRLLVRHAPVCIHEIDLDGRLTAMNPAGLAMMGVDNESAICGMPYLDVVSDMDRGRIAALMQDALRDGAAHFEFQSAGPDPRDFASNFIPIRDDEGKVARLMGVTRDVTEQRRAERDLRALNESLEAQVLARTAALEDANRLLTQRNQELDDFAAAISHDLKGPLTTVVGLGSLLLSTGPREDQAGPLELMAASSQRMGAMIDELLDLAEVGRVTGDVVAEADLEEVLADVCDDLAHDIRASGAQVSHDPLPRVRATPTEQRRLLQNLVSNALKFHGDEAPRVHVSAARLDRGWGISVQDNGLGFPEDQHDTLFRVFSRLDRDRERQGSGVGLAICKKLVESRGGWLRARSEPGRGSTFTYLVPSA